MSDGDRVSRQLQEEKVTDAFVSMTEALVHDYDVVDLLSTLLNDCIRILGVDAGGILLADAGGDLELVASTSEEADIVETIIVAAGTGPCIDCFATGTPVSVAEIEIDAVAQKWPQFHKAAIEQGFLSTLAVPMRLRHETLGVMNLLSSASHSLSDRDESVAQALADIAMLGILHERNFRDRAGSIEQLHLALDTRIFIEQAKGVLAQEQDLTMTQSFEALRGYAKANGMSLRSVAEAIARHELNAAEIPRGYTHAGPVPS